MSLRGPQPVSSEMGPGSDDAVLPPVVGGQAPLRGRQSPVGGQVTGGFMRCRFSDMAVRYFKHKTILKGFERFK